MQIVDNLTVTMKRFERVRTKCNTTVTELPNCWLFPEYGICDYISIL